jgi:hypothetical protein
MWLPRWNKRRPLAFRALVTLVGFGIAVGLLTNTTWLDMVSYSRSTSRREREAVNENRGSPKVIYLVVFTSVARTGDWHRSRLQRGPATRRRAWNKQSFFAELSLRSVLFFC